MDPENTEALLKLATFYMLGKRAKDAREKVDIVLEKEPDNMDALFLLAGLYDLEKNFFESAATFKKIIEQDPGQSRAYMGLARMFAQQGKMDEAETNLKKAINIDKKAIKPRLSLVSFYNGRKAFDMAEAQIKIAIEYNKDNADLYIILGNHYFRRKQYSNAEDAYLKAIKIDQKNVKPYMVAAGFYDATGNFDKTVSMYNKALGIDPEDIRVMDTMARFYLKNNKIEDAKILIDKVIKVRPNYFSTRMMKGEIAALNGNYAEAIGIFDQLISDDPGSYRAHYLKGFSHMGKGENQLAKVSLAKAVELNPKFIKARLLLSELYLREDNLNGTIDQCREVLTIDSDNYQARLNMGKAFMAQGLIKEAELEFKMLIKKQPENPMGYYRLGIVQRHARHYKDAISSFETALSKNEKLVDVFANLILVYVDQKDFDSALTRCNEQMKKVGNSSIHKAVIYNLKGGVLAAQNKMDQAEAAFNSAIDANPDFLKPYFALAKIYLSSQRQEKAIEQYKSILKKKPDQAGPHMLLGTIYDMQKKYDLSEKHYRSALEINPNFVPAANNLAYLLSSKEESLDEALKLAQLAKSKLPDDASIMDTLGWIYFKKGLYGNAIREFTDSLDKLPGNPIVYYHLGAAYLKNGRKAEAKAQLEKALEIDDSFNGAKDAMRMLSEL